MTAPASVFESESPSASLRSWSLSFESETDCGRAPRACVRERERELNLVAVVDLVIDR